MMAPTPCEDGSRDDLWTVNDDRSKIPPSAWLSAGNDAEALHRDEAEVDCCEPADNVKQDVQECLRTVTGANQGDRIKAERRERGESAENADEDELAPIRAHLVEYPYQSGEHTDHAAADDVDN